MSLEQTAHAEHGEKPSWDQVPAWHAVRSQAVPEKPVSHTHWGCPFVSTHVPFAQARAAATDAAQGEPATWQRLPAYPATHKQDHESDAKTQDPPFAQSSGQRDCVLFVLEFGDGYAADWKNSSNSDRDKSPSSDVSKAKALETNSAGFDGETTADIAVRSSLSRKLSPPRSKRSKSVDAESSLRASAGLMIAERAAHRRSRRRRAFPHE